jgi:hypothetical protein
VRASWCNSFAGATLLGAAIIDSGRQSSAVVAAEAPIPAGFRGALILAGATVSNG